MKDVAYPGGMISAILVGVVALTTAHAQKSARLPYDEPNFGAQLFESGAVVLDPVRRELLTRILMDVVGDINADGFTRGKAMALAYAIGSHREVIEKDFALRYGRSQDKPEARIRVGVPGEAPTSKRGLLLDFYQDVPEPTLRPYVLDIASSLSRSITIPPRESADWSPVFSDGAKSSAGRLGGQRDAYGAIYFEQPGAMTDDEGGSGGGFKKRQSLIKGLLVQVLQGSNFAGGATQMNATVLQGLPGQSTVVVFNQEVGESMESGLVKVVSFMNSIQPIPPAHRVEISFESQYSPKDGDSASVACCLLLESLITGADIDPGFAVTGAMDSDGTVKPVGGIDGKIRGATTRKCSHVAIPSSNEQVLRDMLITDGIEPMARIQVFTIETFEAAKALAVPAEERSAKLKEAMELFATVQQVVGRSGARMLGNGQVQQRLGKVLNLAPNHASAKMLLLVGQGRTPQRLSLRGSLTAIDRAALPLYQGLQNDDFLGKNSALDSDEFATAAVNLKRIRSKLDQRAQATADAIVEFSELIRIVRNNPPSSPKAKRNLSNNIATASARVKSTHKSLLEKVRIELGIEDDEEENEDNQD